MAVFPNKFEKVLLYPVVIVSTIATAQFWTRSEIEWLAIVCLLVTGVLWASPFIKYKKLARASFWISLTVIILGILWMAVWYFSYN